jgi:hypothetical protein
MHNFRIPNAQWNCFSGLDYFCLFAAASSAPVKGGAELAFTLLLGQNIYLGGLINIPIKQGALKSNFGHIPAMFFALAERHLTPESNLAKSHT